MTQVAAFASQTYSNGLSEVILGNVIKKLGLPREELVIMTKVRSGYFSCLAYRLTPRCTQLCYPVASETGIETWLTDPKEFGIINQIGLSRKVRTSACIRSRRDLLRIVTHSAYLRWREGQSEASST